MTDYFMAGISARDPGVPDGYAFRRASRISAGVMGIS